MLCVAGDLGRSIQGLHLTTSTYRYICMYVGRNPLLNWDTDNYKWVDPYVDGSSGAGEGAELPAEYVRGGVESDPVNPIR